MTARKPTGYPCHIDEDLAHVDKDDTDRANPCTRRHKPLPENATSAELTRAGLAPRTRVRLLPEPHVPRETKAPAKSPGPAEPARSGPKREAPTPVRSGAAYTAEQRAEALRLLEAHGMAHAHRVTGVPKATLSRWAKAAGVDLGEQARARTAAATATVEAAAAELALTTVARLELILERELTTHARIAALEAGVSAHLEAAVAKVEAGERVVAAEVGMMGAPYLVLRHPDDQLGQLTGLLELAGKSLAKRDVVGAWTRAIHDLALLKGDATERGTILVRFGIPRPDAAAADAAAVDEVNLTTPPPT